MINECEIIDKIVKGDKDAFRKLVDLYADKIFALTNKMIQNSADAEDITQEIFVKVYFSLSKYRKESSFSTWIYRITYNTIISKLRKKKTLIYKDDIDYSIKEIDDSEESKFDKIITEEKYIKLENALENLKPEDRFILLAFYKENKKISEIADITNQSIANIKVKLFRIKKSLAQTLSTQITNN